MNSIVKMKVDNFQSHEHSELVFRKGLNVIVGPSDFGKSALVRALRWLFYNEPRGANFIRVGARTCRVSVEMGDGTKITRLRTTSGKNQYLLQRPGEEEQVYEGFGNEIPQEIINASGVMQVMVDERNKIELNMGAQLEGPFLLTENGSVRAKMIGQLGGVHIIDWAQKSTITDLRRLHEEEGNLSNRLSQVETSLKEYEDLDDIESQLQKTDRAVQRMGDLTRKIDILGEIEQRRQELTADLTKTVVVLEKITFIEQAEDILVQLNSLFYDFRTASRLEVEYDQLNRQLERVERILKATKDVDEAEELLSHIRTQGRQIDELQRNAQEITVINLALDKIEKIDGSTGMLDRLEDNLAAIEERVQALRSFQDMYLRWQEHERDYQGASLAASRYQAEMDRYLNEFRQLLQKLGKCPVCYGELTPEAIERAIGEYE